MASRRFVFPAPLGPVMTVVPASIEPHGCLGDIAEVDEGKRGQVHREDVRRRQDTRTGMRRYR